MKHSFISIVKRIDIGLMHFISITILSLLFTFHSYAEVNYSVLSFGYIGSDFPPQSFVIKDSESLERVLGQIKYDSESLSVDFVDESIALIIPAESSYPDNISINKIESKEANIIKVYYGVDSVPYVQDKNENLSKPYLLLKLEPVHKDQQISLVNFKSNDPLFVDQSLGFAPTYSNILKHQEDELFLKYLPLDKGNSWTYDFESNVTSGTQTFSITSTSNGWSVYDSYFGKISLAMKIDPGGTLLISTKKGVRQFYTDTVLMDIDKKPFEVKAGKFKDVLVVESSQNSQFQFKDVYAKGVGLIYHEHESPKGSAKYSLSQAKVRGKNVSSK